MTRFAWLTFALVALPLGCTLLANNALPDGAAGGGGPGGGLAGSGPTTGGGGTASGTATGSGGSEGGAGGIGGGSCEPIAMAEIECLNGLDDECDGNADCDDPACAATSTCKPYVAGAQFVIDGATSCPTFADELTLATCHDCGCEEDGPGTCFFQTSLYDAPGCSGEAVTTVDVQASECTDVTVSGANGGNVYASTVLLPFDPPTCTGGGTAMASTTRTVCVLDEIGHCDAEGQGCVPNITSGTACLLLEGDVACPASVPNREIVYVGTTAMCPCDCGGVAQICDSSKHTHAHPGAGCPGGYKSVKDTDGCVDTGFTSVLSVDNHDDPLPAVSATCGNQTPPAGGTAKTLCCE